MAAVVFVGGILCFTSEKTKDWKGLNSGFGIPKIVSVEWTECMTNEKNLLEKMCGVFLMIQKMWIIKTVKEKKERKGKKEKRKREREGRRKEREGAIWKLLLGEVMRGDRSLSSYLATKLPPDQEFWSERGIIFISLPS